MTPQGIIFFNNTHKFHSPSSFSMHIIRMLNPERNLDNGWQTVKYCGRVLRTFKKQYLTDKQLVQGQSLAPEGSRAKRCRNVEPFSNLKTLEHSSRAVVRLSCNKPAQISKPFVASERKILNLTPIKPNLKPLAAVFPRCALKQSCLCAYFVLCSVQCL